MTTVIDTDALIGLADRSDALHKPATRIAEALLHRKARVLLLPTTLTEFATVAAKEMGLTQAKKAVHVLLNRYTLLAVDEVLAFEAVKIYDRQTSKKNTLFDCYVMAMAVRVSADCIFAFDAGYTHNNFALAKDFLAQF